METQAGTTQVTLDITPGSAVQGKINPGDFKGMIEETMVNGNNISFAVKIEHGAFSGTIAGYEIRFNVSGTQGDKCSPI